MHSEDSWLPFDQGEDVWHHEGAYLPSRPERVRRWGMVAGIVVVGLAIAVGGGAFGADAYATHAICAAVGQTGPVRTPDGAAKNSTVALDKARHTLDETAALLFFHPELRSATRALAHDLADMRVLQDAGDPAAAPAEATGRMLAVAMSVDSHARQAQTACGLPAEGVLNAAAAPRAPIEGAGPQPPVGADDPEASTGAAGPQASTGAAGPQALIATEPAPPAVTPTGDATPRPRPRASATPGTAAPTYAGELWTAEQMVVVTAQKDHSALVSPTASAVERQVTSYEHAAAVQRLADLKAGTPNARHHALDVRGAQARLAAAEEAYRRTMVDPAATALDRSQARAIVEQWDEALTRLEK